MDNNVMMDLVLLLTTTHLPMENISADFASLVIKTGPGKIDAICGN
jgi:uncharacterized protein YcgI (DUF1989 family)